jgi:DNA-binding NtrC family response regulator
VLQLMVADREALICDTIAAALAKLCGAHVLSTHTGSTALEAMNSAHLDAAILEADLPGISGFALAEHAADRHIPVLLIPAHPDAMVMCRRYGYLYLPKPFLLDKLARETLGIIRRAKDNIERVQASSETLKGTFDDLAQAIQTARRLVAESAEILAQGATVGCGRRIRNPFMSADMRARAGPP